MEGICVGKDVVIGLRFIFALFADKTLGNCVYNCTAEKQRSFSSFIAWDVADKLMSYNLLVVLVMCKWEWHQVPLSIWLDL